MTSIITREGTMPLSKPIGDGTIDCRELSNADIAAYFRTPYSTHSLIIYSYICDKFAEAASANTAHKFHNDEYKYILRAFNKVVKNYSSDFVQYSAAAESFKCRNCGNIHHRLIISGPRLRVGFLIYSIPDDHEKFDANDFMNNLHNYAFTKEYQFY